MNAYWSTLSKFKIQNKLEDVCIYWSTNFELRKQTRRGKQVLLQPGIIKEKGMK